MATVSRQAFERLKRVFLAFLALPALLSIPVLSGCDDRPQLGPLPTDATIVAFGDSLTYGTGASTDESYPAILAELTGRRVVNAGVPGEVSAAGLKRLPGVLDEHRPQLLILCHGGNDFLRRLSAAAAADNLRSMALIARERGVDVVLVGVPKLGFFLDTAPFYGEIAAELELPFAADVISDILSERELKSDAIHPNAAGYRLLAERLAELLDTAGAL